MNEMPYDPSNPSAPPPPLLRHDEATNRYLPVTLADAVNAQDKDVIALIRNLISLLEATLDFSTTTLDKLSQVYRVNLHREVPFELIVRKQALDRKLKTLRDKLTTPA